MEILLTEQKRRRNASDPRWRIPLCLDHGHELLDIGKPTHPGYPMIDRFKGLAEFGGCRRWRQFVGSRFRSEETSPCNVSLHA